MAKNQTVRLKPSLIQADKEAFAAASAITGYAPANNAFTIANGTTKTTTMVNKQTAEAQAYAAADTARDVAAAAEWDFHNYVLGLKAQVAAQFGDDSNELQSLGLKKKSEYKSPKPKAKKSA